MALLPEPLLIVAPYLHRLRTVLAQLLVERLHVDLLKIGPALEDLFDGLSRRRAGGYRLRRWCRVRTLEKDEQPQQLALHAAEGQRLVAAAASEEAETA